MTCGRGGETSGRLEPAGWRGAARGCAYHDGRVRPGAVPAGRTRAGRTRGVPKIVTLTPTIAGGCPRPGQRTRTAPAPCGARVTGDRRTTQTPVTEDRPCRSGGLRGRPGRRTKPRTPPVRRGARATAPGQRGPACAAAAAERRRQRVGDGRLRWARIDTVWSLLLVLLAFTITTLGVTRAISLSPFDEASHIDYAWAVSHFNLPFAGSTMAPEVLQEWSCPGARKARSTSSRPAARRIRPASTRCGVRTTTTPTRRRTTRSPDSRHGCSTRCRSVSRS